MTAEVYHVMPSAMLHQRTAGAHNAVRMLTGLLSHEAISMQSQCDSCIISSADCLYHRCT